MSHPKIVFASANAGKIQEINRLIEGYTLLGLPEVGIFTDIPEPGATIAENSLLKARFVSNYLKEKNNNLPVFADDSGLEVEALGGAPGVYSARYAGLPKSDANNNSKLLQQMRLITSRRARFVTVITLIVENWVFYFEGEIKGTIAYEPRGTGGFGYDPLFIPQGYRSTFAELGPEVKNTISHRALAVKQLRNFLSTKMQTK